MALSPEAIQNFVCSQFSGPRPWYFLVHKSNDFENTVKCPVVIFATPTGNRSTVTSNVYV